MSYFLAHFSSIPQPLTKAILLPIKSVLYANTAISAVLSFLIDSPKSHNGLAFAGAPL